MKKGFFVTGTDTGIGKTLVSTSALKAFAREGYRVAGMKPVATGCEETEAGLQNEDALLLQQCSSVRLAYEQVNPYAFQPAVSPHIAAALAHTEISLDHLYEQFLLIQQKCDVLIVEGVGGWEVPLNRSENVSHLAARLGLPVILVVGLRLGCLNHAILTSNSIREKGLEFAGWVVNCIDPQMNFTEENIQTLHAKIHAPFLGKIPYLESPGFLEQSLIPDITTILTP